MGAKGENDSFSAVAKPTLRRKRWIPTRGPLPKNIVNKIFLTKEYFYNTLFLVVSYFENSNVKIF